MKFPSQHNNNKRRNLAPGTRRASRAAVLPLVAFIIVLGVAFMAFSVDVMRTAYASSAVRYGAEAAALGAFSASLTRPEQVFSRSQAEANIRQTIGQASGAIDNFSWNRAPYGPDSSAQGLYAAESAVKFDASDVTVVNNPNSADSGDYFLQVRGRRDDSDALKLFFLPLIYAFSGSASSDGLPGPAVPAEARLASPHRLVEVIAQPASRIGAGVPRISTSSSSAAREQELIGFATLPVALSNLQFKLLADPNSARSTAAIKITLAPSAASAAASSNTMRGALVNLTRSASSLNYYNDAASNTSVNQLLASLAYFAPVVSASEIPPALVERGSRLSAFNLSSSLFTSATVQQQLLSQLQKLQVGRSYIFPVLASDPNFVSAGPSNEVVGFARLRLLSTPVIFDQSIALTVMLEPDSVALRNASFANAAAVVPSSASSASTSLLPAPVAPFKARVLLSDGLGISSRPHSVVMAPSLSPRVMVN
ncbi:MAG: hypothetical protein QG574_3857 [Cyanobacteriota bacterium erpe_2018_sw_21hr_WHONDRS-SW48-000092_B_bin.40]|jgi:hypothetical protein|nr:hypothetical protein [Cyanobacteriota bacterium erpe_2018_sw_21hr_WHONDRS-SW48-000092_B_bin.40]